MPSIPGLLVWLHISLMFVGVTLSYGPSLLFLIALRSRRTENVRAVLVAVQPVVRFIPVAYGLAALFGVLAAINIGYNLLAPWLLIAYVLFVVLIGIGAGLVGPRLQRVKDMVDKSPDGPLAAETYAAATAGGFVWIEVLDFAGLFLVIFDMVVKPFS
jgi:uncharacterized membrane protein